MEREQELTLKLERIEKATEQLNQVKADIEKSATEARRLNEETTKFVKIETKISELKTLKQQHESRETAFSENCAKERASISADRAEADRILTEAKDAKTQVEKDQASLDADRAKFSEEKTAFYSNRDAILEEINIARDDVKEQRNKLQADQQTSQKLIEDLKAQEARTADAMSKLEISIKESTDKLAEIDKRAESVRAEAKTMQDNIDTSIAKNQGLLDEMKAENTRQEGIKSANQKILDDTNAAKEIILEKEARVAGMLNRQADIQAEQDKREEKLKDLAKRLNVQC